MEFVLEVVFLFLVLLTLFRIFLLYRNGVTLRVRTWFIDDDPSWPVGYHCLPSYGSMMANPKYYLLWTVRDWQMWLARQQKGE